MLDMNLNESVRYLFDIFNSNNFELFLVGGALRNLYIGLPVKDYDFTTNATPIQMKAIAQKYTNIEIILTGEKYGTLTFRLNNENFEITTYRKDSNYSDGRRPDSIIFSNSIYEDLSRRDLTINAIAYNPYVGIVDPFDGITDIKNKTIRTVGDPEQRFNEDALRIMRALRLSYKLKFEIEPKTEEALIKNVQKLSMIAYERINSELIQILDSYDYNISQKSFLKVSEYIFKPDDGINFERLIKSKKFRHLKSCIERVIYMYYVSNKNFEIYKFKKFLYNLKFGNDFISRSLKIISFIIENSNDDVDISKYTEVRVKVKEWLYNIGISDIKSFIRLKLSLKPSMPISSYIYFNIIDDIISNKEPYMIKDLAINGNDLIAMGLKGKDIGDALKSILKYIWNNPESNNFKSLCEFSKILIKNS